MIAMIFRTVKLQINSCRFLAGSEISRFCQQRMQFCFRMAQIIDGKKLAETIRSELREEVDKWIAKGNRKPQLTAVLVGDDPASCTYVKNKMTAAADVGIDSITKRLPSTISEKELLDTIKVLNEDDNVDGILVQLPVPEHISENKISNAIIPEKDVDGFTDINFGRMCRDMHSIVACTPLAVQEILKRTGTETFGKNAVVVGRSKNVGLPIAILLHADGRNETKALDATVTICHRFTPPEELEKYCKLADIIVSATGVPHLIKAHMVKPGATIIDVGITRVMDEETGKYKLVGDVDFEEVKKIAGHITPVPGGVGPMTVAMLMKNTVAAAIDLAGKRKS